jgi:hypothetical protein
MSMPMTPPVPELSDVWIEQRRRHIEHELILLDPRRPARPAWPGVPRLALAAVAVVVLAALAFLLRGVLGSEPRAFAGWTAVPTRAIPGQVARVEARCPHSSPMVLTDTRGPFSLLLFAGPERVELCIGGPSMPRNSAVVPASNQTQVRSVGAAAITVATAGAVLVYDPVTKAAYRIIDGQSGADVTGVTLVLDDGSRVQATTANGWYAAWWPGTHGVIRAQVRTATGVHGQRLRVKTLAP